MGMKNLEHFTRPNPQLEEDAAGSVGLGVFRFSRI
jgi:hypothetical protein